MQSIGKLTDRQRSDESSVKGAPISNASAVPHSDDVLPRPPTLVGLIACVALAAAIFSVDLILPLGLKVGTSYVTVVLVALWLPERRAILIAAFACTGLSVAGFYFGLPAGEAWQATEWHAIGNRALSLLILWAIAFLCMYRKGAELALRQSEERFKDFASSAADWFWETGPDLRLTYLAGPVKQGLGIEPEALLGQPRNEILRRHAVLDAGALEHNVADIEGRRPFKDFEFEWVRPDGRIRTIASTGQPMFGPDREFEGYRGAARDITEHRHMEEALIEQMKRAQVTLHSIKDAVITADNDGVIDYMNPIAEELTGWTLAAARGRSLGEVLHIVDELTRERVRDLVEWCSQSRATAVTGLTPANVLISRDGREHTIEDSAGPLLKPSGEATGIVVVFWDATEQRRLTRELNHQATHDALTSLINRSAFEQRLGRVLRTSQREGTEHVLCYLDLDQFKLVNDTCGHVAGDELLRQLGGLLKGLVRVRDTVARLGGDEFAILMEHCSIEQGRRAAEAVRKGIADFRFTWEDKCFAVGASIGLVPLGPTVATIGDVLTAADSACYAAKTAGRNCIRVHRRRRSKRRRGREWAPRIESALEGNRFELHLQPIASLSRPLEEWDRGELLLRMQDERGQLILPDAFMPAVERCRLAARVDRWVIEHALEWLGTNHPLAARIALCSINLSGQSLADPEFHTLLLARIRSASIAPQRLCFEITETAAITNLGAAVRLMHALKALGCRFALDDFGSGLSSFAYLKHLPVDGIKIDDAFIKDIARDELSLALVKSIKEIASVMAIETTAELVNARGALEQLRAIGVDYAQGDLIGRPQPVAPVAPNVIPFVRGTARPQKSTVVQKRRQRLS